MVPRKNLTNWTLKVYWTVRQNNAVPCQTFYRKFEPSHRCLGRFQKCLQCCWPHTAKESHSISTTTSWPRFSATMRYEEWGMRRPVLLHGRGIRTSNKRKSSVGRWLVRRRQLVDCEPASYLLLLRRSARLITYRYSKALRSESGIESYSYIRKYTELQPKFAQSPHSVSFISKCKATAKAWPATYLALYPLCFRGLFRSSANGGVAQLVRAAES